MAKEQGFANFTPKQDEAFIKAKAEEKKRAHTGLELHLAKEQMNKK